MRPTSQEILTSYGSDYFGDGNAECLCATCEKSVDAGKYKRPTTNSVLPRLLVLGITKALITVSVR
jgi:hypothetical protein